MKLHLISATNLNSLYGEHTVDLDRDLDGASLFLIHGPTGAGKSTLMDAVSLALFGATPRLENKRGEVPPGEQIMSRGTGECQAAVAFSKRDTDTGLRVRYRATWKAHRAYKRSDGTLRPAERSLERQEPDGSWTVLVSDHRPTNTQPFFDDVLEGFTIEDFQRSMLLAQGRFDAMLHANPSQRAEILERLTQTSEYERIGLRAAQMRAAWVRVLERLQATRDAISPLQAEAREALVEREAELKARLNELERSIRGIDEQRRWLVDRAAHRLAKSQAHSELAAVGEAERQVQEDQAALSEFERCEAAFGLWGQARAAKGRIEITQDARKKTQAELPALTLHREQTEQAVTILRAALQAAETGANDIESPVELARAALGEAQTAKGKVEEALADQTGAARELKARQDRAEALERELKATATHAESARERAEAIAGDQALTDSIGELRDAATAIRQQAKRAREEQTALTQDRANHQREQDALAQERSTFSARRSQVLDPLVASHAAASEAVAQLVGQEDPERVARTLTSELQAQRERLRLLREAAVRVERRDEALSEARRRASQSHEALRDLLGHRQELPAARSTVRSRTDALARTVEVLTPLERIAALSDQRAELVKGEACPLCGSETHPFTQDPTKREQAEAIAVEVERARTQRDRAQADLEQSQDRLRALERAIDLALATRDRSTAESRDAVAAALDLQSRADEALAEVGLSVTDEVTPALRRIEEALATPPDEVQPPEAEDQPTLFRPVSPPQLASSLQALDTPTDAARIDEAEREVSEQITRLEARQAQLAEAQRTLGAASQALQDQRDDLAATQARLATQEARLSQRGGDLDQRGERLDQARTELTDARRALAQRLRPLGIDVDPPEDGLLQAQTRVEAWRRAQDELKTRLHALETATEKKRAADEAVQTASRAFDQQVERLARSQESYRTQAAAASNACRDLNEVWQRCAPIPHDLPEDLRQELHDATARRLRGGPDELPAEPATLRAILRDRLARLRREVDQADKARQEAHTAMTRASERLVALAQQLAREQGDLERTERDLATLLADLDLSSTQDLEARHLAPEQLTTLRSQRDQLRRRRAQAEARAEDADRTLSEHLKRRPQDLPEDAQADRLTEEREALIQSRDALTQTLTEVQAGLLQAAKQHQQLQDAQEALDTASSRARIWLELHELIGVAKGRRFKEFAQALNLAQLLERANRHLRTFGDRYQLRPILDPDTGLPTLEFAIEDLWQHGTERSIKTLSGGESFLVSLALALGLSDLRTSSMPIETLLLDEGFGTLDSETLETALSALSQLQSSGRQVGIISHVPGLPEKVEARIVVEAVGGGRSRVRTEVGRGLEPDRPR
ncbi:MAG: hypothetical protein EA397_00555 [Deltaproteobacteria bacterium]|nr:MAG: hypothetical protein EA397_00555 [Deltaproteobacteria bacterium]